MWFWPVLTEDVRIATAGGTLFKGYIGDATYAARLRMHDELVARTRRGGLGIAVRDDDEEDVDGEVGEPAAGEAQNLLS